MNPFFSTISRHSRHFHFLRRSTIIILSRDQLLSPNINTFSSSLLTYFIHFKVKSFCRKSLYHPSNFLWRQLLVGVGRHQGKGECCTVQYSVQYTVQQHSLLVKAKGKKIGQSLDPGEQLSVWWYFKTHAKAVLTAQIFQFISVNIPSIPYFEGLSI